jgi:hypothetical protein
MYDIIFICYKEPNAEKNFSLLKERFPLAKKIEGVKGIHQAHLAAARKSFTKMFWVVDADAVVLDDFNFNYQPDDYNLDTVHVWSSRNPLNKLEYGYGGVKLLPKKLTLAMDLTAPDMTTSISKKFKAMDVVSNITAFNTDPFSSWRSAFRECAKLSSRIIRGQVDAETDLRLSTWVSIASGEYSAECLEGATAGKRYGITFANNPTELAKINDFDWLLYQWQVGISLR